MEGVGCYHPVFPATNSDVTIWAGLFVKEIIYVLENGIKEKLKFFKMEKGDISIVEDEEV